MQRGKHLSLNSNGIFNPKDISNRSTFVALIDLHLFQVHLHMSQSELRRIFQVEHHNDGEFVFWLARREGAQEPRQPH